MSKYQEALDIISSMNTMNLLTIGERSLTKPLVAKLQELVDKETPMKPIHLGGNKYSCKNCSMAFELNTKVRFVNNQYCDVCSQKLDWSGGDE